MFKLYFSTNTFWGELLNKGFAVKFKKVNQLCQSIKQRARPLHTLFAKGWEPVRWDEKEMRMCERAAFRLPILDLQPSNRSIKRRLATSVFECLVWKRDEEPQRYHSRSCRNRIRKGMKFYPSNPQFSMLWLRMYEWCLEDMTFTKSNNWFAFGAQSLDAFHFTFPTSRKANQ